MNNIIHQVKKIISQILEIDIKMVQEQTNLFTELKVDSLDTIEIAMAIEKKFQLEIPDEDLEQLNTVNLIAQYIKTKQKNTLNKKDDL